MDQMSRTSEGKSFFFLFIILGSLFLIFTPLQQEFSNSDNNQSFLDESNLKITSNALFNDLLIMFKEKIPDIDQYEKFIIKKYVKFPIVRINFDTLAHQQAFLKQHGNKIYQIEPNRILKLSLDDIQEEKPKNSISKINFQDVTGATYLINQLGITGNRTRIGIIDTGVADHTIEFGTRIKGRGVFVNQDNGYSQDVINVTDNHGHGTHVAGLAAGTTTGMAPEAEIYSAKVIQFGVTGAGGGDGEETTAGLLEAIEYLVNNSVDVINISLGQYHNLPSGLRDEMINYISMIHNIVFSISIGNSGTSYGDRGTLNNPGTALQCIGVTASDVSLNSIANFASRGPKSDYSMKPDISAPGTNIYGPGLKSGYDTRSGTSMAAPIVGGAAALLIDYLKMMNQTYTAGTVKAALLAGARSLGEPIWEEGSGFLNVTRSWEILNTSTLINDSPDIGYLHPTELPFDPYKVLFNGSSVEFNLTAISGIAMNHSINISESLTEFVHFQEDEYLINNTCLIPVNFTIPKITTPQFVIGNISVGNLTLQVEFEIRKPVARILFDESLNKIVPHGYSTNAYEIQGDSSNTIGMFSKFIQFLSYDNNYSVTPHVTGDLTLPKLLAFDVLILANPVSLASDIYMDWLIDPGNDYILLSETTKNAISQFVSLGKGLLIFNAFGTHYNRTGLNLLLDLFDIQIQTLFNASIQTSGFTDHSLNFTDTIDSFPFRGNYLQKSGTYTQTIAEYSGASTIISYQGPTGGRVLVFGTDLIFDNIGFSNHAYGGNTEHNRVLAFNSVAWLAQGTYRATTTTNIPEFSFVLILLVLVVVLAILAVRKGIIP